MRRRTYLIGGAGLVSTIAGCGSPGPGANGTETDGLGAETEPGTPTGIEEESPTEAETPTEMEGSPTETGTPTDVADGMETIEMVTEGDAYYFDPIGLAVEPGTTVEWTVASGEHSSTAYEDRIPEAAQPWDSGVLAEGETTTVTFEESGTYDYYCTPHQAQGMVGRMVVGDPGGPAEGSMPPDSDVPESQRIVEEGSVSYTDFTAT